MVLLKIYLVANQEVDDVKPAEQSMKNCPKDGAPSHIANYHRESATKGDTAVGSVGSRVAHNLNPPHLSRKSTVNGAGRAIWILDKRSFALLFRSSPPQLIHQMHVVY